jgi:DNA-directed RNA polymerase specialized sigma subunit
MSATNTRDGRPTIEQATRRLTELSQVGTRREASTSSQSDAPLHLTGWDRLVQAITEKPAVYLRPDQRRTAIQHVMEALCWLGETEFTVVALRYGLTPDDRDIEPRSRREASDIIDRSHSRVAQLERGGVARLRSLLLEPKDTLSPFLEDGSALMLQRRS